MTSGTYPDLIKQREYDPLLNIDAMACALAYNLIRLDSATRPSCAHTVRMRLDLDHMHTMNIHDIGMG